jgi:hypothetical protein
MGGDKVVYKQNIPNFDPYAYYASITKISTLKF